ncbi:MAG: lipoprotein NlpD [Halioglobus sp.]|jgi:lipoprotein NlpD
MKQLPRACYIGFLALSAAACQSMSEIDTRLQSLELNSDTYIVRAGESLESIAFRYRLSPTELASLNPGVGQQVPVGSRLNIRTPNQQAGYGSQAHSISAANVRRGGVASGTSSTNRNEFATAQPVYMPKAVPFDDTASTRQAVYGQNGSVLSDSSLLSSGAVPVDRVMRAGVMEPITYVQQEIVEEEYIHNNDVTLVRRDVQRQPVSGGNWTWPTQGPVARGYAPDTEDRHGIDIAGVPGQRVVAVLDGTVAYSGKDPSGAGNLVIVRHKNTLLTAYSHTRDLYVAEDDTVRAGDPIATLGANTQNESVLRFEVRRDGNSLNPMEFLSAQ